MDADRLAQDLLGHFGGDDPGDAESVGHSTEAMSELVAEMDQLRDFSPLSGTPWRPPGAGSSPGRTASPRDLPIAAMLDLAASFSAADSGLPKTSQQMDSDNPPPTARLWTESAALKRRRPLDEAPNSPLTAATSDSSDPEDPQMGCNFCGAGPALTVRLVARLCRAATGWLTRARARTPAAATPGLMGGDRAAEYTAWLSAECAAQGMGGVVEDVLQLLRTKQLTAADRVLQQALSEHAADPAGLQQLHAWRAKVLAMSQADLDTIIEECTCALEGNAQRWRALPLVLRARCYATQGETALAVADYERLLAVDPAAPEAIVELPRLREAIPDLYGVLRVAPTATSTELGASYRRLLLCYHPDRQAGESDEARRRARVQFDALQEAYALLADPARRREYDEFRAGAQP